MHQFRMTVGGVTVALLLCGVLGGPVVLAGPAVLEAQVSGPGPDGRWPLQPRSPGNRHLAPFMEGWYADMEETDVWWTIRKPNGDVSRVPGRIGAVAYQLDWFARPHGSMHPLVSFDGQNGDGRGPPGLMADRVETASVGSPVTLSVNARDPSERDQDDFRFRNATPVNVTWSQLQGPGRVEFTRHESNPLPEPSAGRGGRGGGGGGGAAPDSAAIAAAIAAGGAGAAAAAARSGGRGRGRASPPQNIRLTEGYGTGSAYATFSVPGEYLMRARVDNFNSADSSGGDQCCWTNAFIRVTVTP